MLDYKMPYWYVVRTEYNRELKLVKQLEEKNVEYFIPKKQEFVIEDEQKHYVEVPAIHNLVFIHSTRNFLDEYQRRRAKDDVPIRYMFDLATRNPIIVRESDMHNFIRVTKLCNENILYLKDNIDKFKSHPKVRVTAGRFEGIEGYVVRIRRDRKLVIQLHGIIAIAISGIHHSLLEIID